MISLLNPYLANAPGLKYTATAASLKMANKRLELYL